MKKRIIALMAIASVAFSCQDAYNVEQPGQQFEDTAVYRTAEDIERGVSSIYTFIPGESEIKFVSFFTDELGVGRDNGGQGINDGSYRFFMDSGTAFPTAFWNANYALINRINRMLSTIDYLLQTSPQDASLHSSARELRLIRAYANLRLFAYFTPDYTNPSGLSIMKFDFLQTDDYEKSIPRVSVQEIVDFIEEDVAYALRPSTVSEPGSLRAGTNRYVNTSFAYGVLVKLYSMTRNYTDLKTNFEILGGTNISIGTALSFSEMFSVVDHRENTLDSNQDIVFRLVRVPQDTDLTRSSNPTDDFRVNSSWWSSRVNTNPDVSSAYMEVGRSLYNALDVLDPAYINQGVGGKDLRYNSVILSGSTPYPNYSSLEADDYREWDLIFIGKYPGHTQSPLQNDIMIMRRTDLYLCYLEALAHEGDLAGVQAGLNRIRAARTIPGTTPESVDVISVQDAYAKILQERRVEFAFEGHRYLDMKRLGQRAGSPGFVRDAKDCENNGACQLEVSSHKLTLPIPRTEISSNPLVAQQQNPGY